MTAQEQESAMAVGRAARIELGEFAEAMTAGILRAMDARTLVGKRPGEGIVRPWIWAGWIIGDEGRFGPVIGPNNPIGPGGPGR